MYFACVVTCFDRRAAPCAQHDNVNVTLSAVEGLAPRHDRRALAARYNRSEPASDLLPVAVTQAGV